MVCGTQNNAEQLPIHSGCQNFSKSWPYSHRLDQVLRMIFTGLDE